MELVKNSPMEVGWLTWRFEPSAGERLVVVVKATFDLVPEGPCPLSANQALVTGDEPWDGDVEASNRYDSDLALLKPCGEWWLTGTLQREEPARELACRARVGELETRFSVIGDRWWEPAGGMSAPNAPGPGDETYESVSGGGAEERRQTAPEPLPSGRSRSARSTASA